MRKRAPKKTSLPRTLAAGVIRVHPRGFGFLIPEERERFPEDIFIPRHAVKGAVDGDEVEVEVNTQFVSEKGPEGRVLRILKRGRSHVGGTVVFTHSKGGVFAHVPLLGPNKQMQVRSRERKLQVGDRIVIHVLDWGNNRRDPQGEMSSYIGHISDPSCDIDAAVEEFDLPDAFPEKVLTEVGAFGTHVASEDLKDRADFRSLECFTIDPDTARDFDDALSLSQDKKGNFNLIVHIADVSHYVRPGTAVDREANQRCNSTYFPGKVLPMLPHELSSHLCSLKPGVNRLAVSVLMTFDKRGSLKEYQITKSVIRSAKRFTYNEAKEVLDGKKCKHAPTLHLMVKLCYLLKKARTARGSIEFSLPDVQLRVDEHGAPQSIELVEYDITHQLVEEFMLKTNEVVATHLAHEGKPLAYRVHEEPSEESIRDFTLLATHYGFKIPPKPSAEQLQRLFDEARSTPFGQFLAIAFIRSMRLATYSTQNIGHYGLGLEYYTHFTSPIRRYIDLMVHRALFDEIDPKTSLEETALQCSEQERLSARAEQAVVVLKKLRLLHASHAEDPDRVYEAVVMNLKPVGFTFEVLPFLIEGFYPFSEIDPSLAFEAGQRIEVRAESVNFITSEVHWILVLKSAKRRKR